VREQKTEGSSFNFEVAGEERTACRGKIARRREKLKAFHNCRFLGNNCISSNINQ